MILPKRALRGIISLFTTLLLLTSHLSVTATGPSPQTEAAILHIFDQNPDAQTRVIVLLNSPVASEGVQNNLVQIADVQEVILNQVSPQEAQVNHRYQTLPAMAMTVTEAGLRTLQQSTQVYKIIADHKIYAQSTESEHLIHADQVRSEYGLTGAGVNVAVIDTGVDVSHPDFAGAIVAQHCFTENSCPPNNTKEGESAQDGSGHGTVVAGILAGRGKVGPIGIAPDAGIVAVRVMDDHGVGWNSDVIAGIDWVLAHQDTLHIKVINLSLGGGSYTGVCDTYDASTQFFAQSISKARQAGIVVFAASGNGGNAQTLALPACTTDAISVGSVYDADLGARDWGICNETSTAADQVSCFSNGGESLDLLAPGAWIEAPALGGGTRGDAGTSMATPHAAAVAALLLQADPTLTPDAIETLLKETGVPITDARNGRATPRIDALAAVQKLKQPQPEISGTVRLQGRTTFSGTQVVLAPECAANTVSEIQSMDEAQVAWSDPQGHVSFPVSVSTSMGCWYAHHPGYLDQHGDLTATFQVQLLGGDVNGDGKIDLYDLVQTAALYGSHDPAGDINGDHKVDIFDLTMIAGNYGLRADTVPPLKK